MNRVMLIGYVGKDPESKLIGADTKVAQLSLATSETYKNKAGEKVSETTWHNIVAWRGLADVAEKYIRKGMRIFVEGKINIRKWEDANGASRYSTDIIASSIIMLGKSERHGNNTDAAVAALVEPIRGDNFVDDISGDLPF